MAGAVPVQTQEDLIPPAPIALGYRWAGVLLAPAVAVVMHVILIGPFGLDLQIPAGPGSSDLQPLGILTTTVVTLILGALGWLLVMGLESIAGGPRGRRIWTVVGVGVFVVSLVPVALLDVDLGAKWGLFALHLAVALVLLPTLANGTESRPDGAGAVSQP